MVRSKRKARRRDGCGGDAIGTEDLYRIQWPRMLRAGQERTKISGLLRSASSPSDCGRLRRSSVMQRVLP